MGEIRVSSKFRYKVEKKMGRVQYGFAIGTEHSFHKRKREGE